MRIQWNERLNNWAPEPPAGAWERLSEALSQSSKPEYAQKLYDFSAPPPPAAWEALAAQLDEQAAPAAPVVRMAPRKKWMRVGSAAATILVAVFFLQPYFPGKKHPINEQEFPELQQSILPLMQLQDRRANVAEEMATTSSPAPGEKSTRNIVAANTILPPKDNDPLPTVHTAKAPEAPLYGVMNTATAQTNNSIVERYIVLATEDNAVRLPKKLYAAYHCDDQPDPASCFEYLVALRKQMAAPSLLAPADFSGLLEVIQRVDRK